MSATPPPYQRQATFTSFQTPQAPTVGSGLEGEFDAIGQSLNATQARLSEIQRDDGKLANLSVHPDALSSAVRAILSTGNREIKGAWQSGNVYDIGDVVERSGASYMAAVQHVAGADFDADLALTKWLAIDTGLKALADLAATPTGASLVGYTPPSTGAASTVRGFLDALWATGASAGAKLIRWIQAGTGAIAQTIEDKLRRTIDAEDYGVLANGVADDTAAMVNAIARAKATGRRLRLPSGTIKTSAALDISGVSIFGCAKGYRNANATIIEGNGTHDVLTQATAGADETRMDLQNLRIKGGLWGIKVRYMLHSRWQNVHVTDCAAGGIQFGNSSDAGGLFNTFENIEVDVTGTGIDINGNGFVNANSFNQCFFKGTQYGGRVRCSGGIGATDNVFNCCEFLGDRYGVELDNTSNTVFNQCYFESLGPSVHFIGTRNIGWAANDCVYAKLENTNATGKNAFFYHAGSGTVRGSIKGGYIYLDNSAVHNNLSFVASENPATFFLFMADQPERDIAATGFVLLNGLTSANLNINDVGTYTPTWTGSGSNPAIGNGTLSGNYVRSGNQVTVSITMTAGSTTTFGTGDWTFSLPFAAQAQSAGACYILDAGTGYFDGTALVGAGSSSVAVYRNGTATLVGAGVPMAWAQNDSITITITYRA